MPRMPQERLFSIITLLLTISVGASAANLKVHCGRTGEDGYSSINAALKKANPQGPNTLTVSGTCNESVLIQSFDRLTLTGQRGASIIDTTNGTGVVLDIVDSHRVSVTGFTISGGVNGVLCEQFSTCYFSANTVQGATDAGVIVAQSNAVFNGDVIQDNAAQGIISLNGSNTVLIGVTLSGNATAGGGAAADARNQSFLQIANSNVHDNGDSGAEAIDNSSLVFSGGTSITGSAGHGVFVERASTVKFVSSGGNVVTGNGGSGVFLRDLSFGFMGVGGATITGNGDLDVNCSAQFPATRGALTNIGGGTTNCVEP